MDNDVLDFEIDEQVITNTEWAGFWIRVGASLLDTIILIPILVLSYYNIISFKLLPLELLLTSIVILYKPIMEYWYGATIGKMILKLKVVSSDYGNISIHQAFYRYAPWLIGQVVGVVSTIQLFMEPSFAMVGTWESLAFVEENSIITFLDYFSSILLLISVVAVAFHDKKQGLHDRLANTYCIMVKPNY